MTTPPSDETTHPTDVPDSSRPTPALRRRLGLLKYVAPSLGVLAGAALSIVALLVPESDTSFAGLMFGVAIAVVSIVSAVGMGSD